MINILWGLNFKSHELSLSLIIIYSLRFGSLKHIKPINKNVLFSGFIILIFFFFNKDIILLILYEHNNILECFSFCNMMW